MLDLLKNKLVISAIIAVIIIIGIYISNRKIENKNEKPGMVYYLSRLLISFGIIYGVLYAYDMYSSGKTIKLGGSKKIDNITESVYCDNPNW